jgi:hypothetical protein
MPYCSERTPERRCAASGAGEAAGGEEQHARRRAQFRRAKRSQRSFDARHHAANQAAAFNTLENRSLPKFSIGAGS